MKWVKGRLGSGYEKLPLFIGKRFDCYLLRMRRGSYITRHVDTNSEGQHYRLNVELKKARRGGSFICEDTLFRFWRFVLFRPDEEFHAVSLVTKGTRYVLSFGFLRKT